MFHSNVYFNTATIHLLEFVADDEVRDTTDWAVRHAGTRIAEAQYLTRAVKVVSFDGGASVELPALFLSGVRVLYQDSRPAGFGTGYLRMAVPRSVVVRIACNLMAKGVSVENVIRCVQDEQIATLNGVEYSIFKAQLGPDAAMHVPSGNKESESWVPMGAGDIFQRTNSDILASVTFNIDLKYKGSQFADRYQAPMTLAFTATSIQVDDFADEALNPRPRTTKSSPLTGAQRRRPSDRLLNILHG